jgi:hypothetical protein
MYVLPNNSQFNRSYADSYLSKPLERILLQRSVTEGYYTGRIFRERQYKKQKQTILKIINLFLKLNKYD